MHFEYPCSFTSSMSVSNPDSCVDIEPQAQPNFDLHRLEMESGVQVRMTVSLRLGLGRRG